MRSSVKVCQLTNEERKPQKSFNSLLSFPITFKNKTRKISMSLMSENTISEDSDFNNVIQNNPPLSISIL
jgi:hypothetical protein